MFRILALFVGAFLASTHVVVAQGCVMCKAVGEKSGFDINPGIILLIAVPYILLFLLFRKKLRNFYREFIRAQG